MCFILCQKLDETMAADCLAQSRSPWSTSSIFPTWKERNWLCNICCCLFTPVLQCISHAKKFIPRWCLQGAVTFFFVVVFMNSGYLESRIAMNCCIGCERKRAEDSADLVLHRSGSVMLSWEQPHTHVPNQTSSLSHGADS